MKPRYLIPLFILVAGGSGLAFWYGLITSNRTIVRNSSGAQVRDLVLVLRELDGKRRLEKKLEILEPGASFTVRHGKNDTRAGLRYVIGGTLREHKENYIDLWTGEGWVFDIQADGTVRSGYDYPRSD